MHSSIMFIDKIIVYRQAGIKVLRGLWYRFFMKKTKDIELGSSVLDKWNKYLSFR